MKNRYLWPLGIFLLLCVFLYKGLSINPKNIPSPLIGKPAPSFTLPQLYKASTIAPADLNGKVWVLNVWASWCTSCIAEHEVVKMLGKSTQVDIVGLNYKDKTEDAKAWLAKLGNPYHYIAVDKEGEAGLDLGVYGVPETFVIDKKGIIRHKFTGPITAPIVNNSLAPLIKTLEQEAI